MKTIKGIPASYGVAIGPAFVYERAALEIECRAIEDPAAELARLTVAQETARQQLQMVFEKALAESGEEQAEIFKAQTMMLDDPELVGAVKKIVENDLTNVEAALHDTVENYANMLEALDDEYLSARALDIRDVGSRMLRILLGVAESPTTGLTQPSIIIARDLTPSDTILLDKTFVLGFCTVKGGATSHTAILARSLGIPAVVGAGKKVRKVKNGTSMILDGDTGDVVIKPDEATLAEYLIRQEAFVRIKSKAAKVSDQPAVTIDGHRVEVVANIGSVEDARSALDAGAEGVGLLRSEFLYLERSSLPTEEEQTSATRRLPIHLANCR